MAAFIDISDGYTLQGTIPAVPGLYGQVEFEYRPMTARERTRLWHHFQTLTADVQFDRQRDAILSHIKKWNLDKPIAAETFETIEGDIFEGLIAEIARLGDRFKPESNEKN